MEALIYGAGTSGLSLWVNSQRSASAYSTSLAVADWCNRCQVSQPSCKHHIPALFFQSWWMVWSIFGFITHGEALDLLKSRIQHAPERQGCKICHHISQCRHIILMRALIYQTYHPSASAASTSAQPWTLFWLFLQVSFSISFIFLPLFKLTEVSNYLTQTISTWTAL